MSDRVPATPIDVDGLLAAYRAGLIADLTMTLDIETGLREATLSARHADLVTDLRVVLDVEAGLSAVLPDADAAAFGRSSATCAGYPVRIVEADLYSGIRDLIVCLGSLDGAARLNVRAHPALSAVEHLLHTLPLARVRARALVRDLRPHELDLAHALARLRDLSRDLDLDLAPARALARAVAGGGGRDRVLARDLNQVLVVARDLELALDHALANTLDRALACALDPDGAARRTVDRDHTLDRARGLARSLARALDRDFVGLETHLDHVRHDFAGADLRRAHLTGASLDGVRWTATTRWPAEWEPRIRTGSVKVADDVYQIGVGGMHVPARLRS